MASTANGSGHRTKKKLVLNAFVEMCKLLEYEKSL